MRNHVVFTLSTALAVLTMASQIGAGQSIELPSADYSTLSAAIAKAQDGDTIIVPNGVCEGSLYLNPGTRLMAKNPRGVTLKGKGRGVIVTLATNSSIDGFIIESGTIGIFSSSAGASITGCKVSNNTQSGIMCIGHLPHIADNIIVYNKGSGIQGWDVRSTSSSITHNTIAYNENHGLAFDGTSDIIAENNIVAFNGQFAYKTDPERTKMRLLYNSFYRNGAINEALPVDNFTCDPLFANPQKLDFSLGGDSKCREAARERKDLGAQIENK